MAMKLPDDFREFLKLLAEYKVRYLLIGGYAVGYHGYPRATQDLDIWIAVHPENADRVVLALREFGFDLPNLTPDLFLAQKSIVRMGLSPLRIELMTTISGVEFETCYHKRIKTEIDGVTVDLIDLRDLRLNKQASGRHKDLDDLEHLPGSS
jgi:predicted nucleotidyltransferase